MLEAGEPKVLVTINDFQYGKPSIHAASKCYYCILSGSYSVAVDS
jgi:hypothetical protein